MTPIADIPINSWCWGLGTLTLIVLGVKSVAGYRRSRGQLTKYMAWFSWLFFVCLALYSVPAFFTLDQDVLRTTSVIGEAFFFAGMVAQAAILWCLILRRYFSIYFATIPVVLISLACWIYDIPRSKLSLSDNFINYHDPRIVSLIVAALMICLFVPVGIYFLRAISLQVGVKAKVTSLMMGMMYVGIGISTATELIISGQIISPASGIINIVIIGLLFIALILPWRLSVRLPAQVQAPTQPQRPSPFASH